ncbi:MAG TPA: hypothetical protein VIG51_00420 [Candidatus Baltobacteraceae bacterium]
MAATALEARAVRRELPAARVVETGIGLAQTSGSAFGQVVISCGLAGGLRDEIASGTVLVPDYVRRLDGSRVRCDDALVAALIDAARSLGFEPVVAPLFTSTTIVCGAERRELADLGYAGVDMETGLIDASRLAAVRVVLDTPSRELSADWAHAASALLRPRNWPQAVRLARDAPRCARRAAQVLARALKQLHPPSS